MATQNRDKKTYKKPTVTQVKLEISQAVLQACKTAVDDQSGKQTTKNCNHPGCSTTQHPS